MVATDWPRCGCWAKTRPPVCNRYLARNQGLHPGTDPYALVLSLNAYRRHLTPEQKRSAIDAFLKAHPTASDRKVARKTGTSDKTVAKRRKAIQHSENPNIGPRPVERAVKAIKDHPEMSNAAIAKLAVASPTTVATARKAVAAGGPVARKPRPKADVPQPEASKAKPVIQSRRTSRHQVNVLEHAEHTLTGMADTIEAMFPDGKFQDLCTPEVRNERVVACKAAWSRITKVLNTITTPVSALKEVD